MSTGQLTTRLQELATRNLAHHQEPQAASYLVTYNRELPQAYLLEAEHRRECKPVLQSG
jgi:hypothetical protein